MDGSIGGTSMDGTYNLVWHRNCKSCQNHLELQMGCQIFTKQNPINTNICCFGQNKFDIHILQVCFNRASRKLLE